MDIPEESTCGKCSMASVCPLKNKVPDAKVTSSKDALWLVYYMACSARYAEMNKEGASTTDSVGGEDSVEKLLAEEAAKQNEQFSEELGVTDGKHSRPPVKLPPDVPLSPDQEFALYLSGIRLLDQMSVLVCNTVQEREKLDEMLETQILEYTTKKKLDQAFRLETGIQQTLTKKRDKREETKGLHDLVAENKRSMEAFSKKFTTTSDFIKEPTDEPTKVAPRQEEAPKTEQREVRRSKNTRKST